MTTFKLSLSVSADLNKRVILHILVSSDELFMWAHFLFLWYNFLFSVFVEFLFLLVLDFWNISLIGSVQCPLIIALFYLRHFYRLFSLFKQTFKFLFTIFRRCNALTFFSVFSCVRVYLQLAAFCIKKVDFHVIELDVVPNENDTLAQLTSTWYNLLSRQLLLIKFAFSQYVLYVYWCMS